MTKNLFKQISWIGMVLGIMLAGTGCDSTNVDPPDAPETGIKTMDLVESMEMRPLNVNETGEIRDYVLEVTLKDVEGIRYPDALNLLGSTTLEASSLVYDDGTAHDRIAGDRVYSGVVSEACSELDLPDGIAAKDIISITISCSGDFIRPGSECEGQGTCPETAERSFLWGLIEYETDIVLCWCNMGCEYDISFELGL